MTTTTTAAPALPTMRPYHKQGEIDYARLDYNPDEPVLKPDAMQQNPPLHEILGLLASRFTDFQRRPDVFLDSNTILCYDPDDLNVRVSPDVYLAFGVDARKPFGGASSTCPGKWASRRIGCWRWPRSAPAGRTWVASGRSMPTSAYRNTGAFDPTKQGEYHGEQLAGDRLVAGEYEPIGR